MQTTAWDLIGKEITHAAGARFTVEQEPLSQSKLKPQKSSPESSTVAMIARWQRAEICA